jgi:protein-tyrosine phosphatase
VKQSISDIPGDMQVADEIIEGLWMGGVQAGKMAAAGLGDFDVIVNLTGESTAWPSKEHNKSYVNFHISDCALPDLDQLDALVQYIASLFIFKTTDHKRRVLVHCTMGINRSGLVCALVARRLKGLTGLEALRLIREKRRVVGTFVSPCTNDRATDTALFNSKFVEYIESLP